MTGSGSGNLNGPDKKQESSDASIIGSKTPSLISSAGQSSKPSSSSPSDGISTPTSAEESSSPSSSPSSAPSSSPSSSHSSAPSSSASSVPSRDPRSGPALGPQSPDRIVASNLPGFNSVTPGSVPGSFAWADGLDGELQRYAAASGIQAGQPAPSLDEVPTGDTDGGEPLGDLPAQLIGTHARAVRKLRPSAAQDGLPDPMTLPHV